MNPIAAIISRLAGATRDGTLNQSVSAVRQRGSGNPFEVVPGPTGQEQAHASSGGQSSQDNQGQAALMAVGPAPGPSTVPGMSDILPPPGSLTQTTGEKGLPPEIAMAMNPTNIPPELMQMMGQQGPGAGGMDQMLPQLIQAAISNPAMVQQIQALLSGGQGAEPSYAAPMDQGGPEGQEGEQEPDADDQNQAGPGEQPQQSDEADLASVRDQMGVPMDPEEYAAKLKADLDSGDDQAVQQCLQEMEEAGMSVDDLPPNLVQELSDGGFLDQQDNGESMNGGDYS